MTYTAPRGNQEVLASLLGSSNVVHLWFDIVLEDVYPHTYLRLNNKGDFDLLLQKVGDISRVHTMIRKQSAPQSICASFYNDSPL